MNLFAVLIWSAQQAMFSMVPQAAGAGNSKKVSDMLTMSLVWTCVIILIPTCCAYWFLGDMITMPEDGGASGYGYGGYGTDTIGGCLGVPEPEPEPIAGPEPEP